jgi:hypothetical protein
LYEFVIASLASNGVASADALTGSISAVGKSAPPSNVTNFASSVDPLIGATLSWTAITDIDFSTYEIRRGSQSDTWETSTLVTQVNATTYKLGFLDPGSFTYRIKAIDTIGIYSTSDASTVVSTSLPNPVTSLTATASYSNLNLQWNAPIITTFAISKYKVTYGDAYASSIQVTITSDVFALIPLSWTSTRKFWVVAVDAAGKESTPVSVSFSVVTTNAPTVSGSFSQGNYVVKWTASTQNTMPVSNWHIRFGDSFANGTQAITPTSGSSTSANLAVTTTAGWYIGTRRIWVAPYYKDTNSFGEAAYIDATVVKASAPALTVTPSKISSSSVVLSWTATAGSLPIVKYEIRYSKLSVTNLNPTWESTANTIVDAVGSPKTLTNMTSGATYRYFIAAKDSAGFVGTPTA